jgi:hypothetical protein
MSNEREKIPDDVIFRATDVELVKLPLVPATAMKYVPGVTDVEVMVSVAVSVPPLKVGGLIDAKHPSGTPDTASVTGLAKELR